MTTTLAKSLMLDFAEDTGLTSEKKPRRYLWTDAYAVGNFLELYHQTGEDRFLTSAKKLVDQVHHVLGRHRDDDSRVGWISGLSDEEGKSHPTCGGLRIGKPHNERKPDEPYDSQLEWDQDGQYFHYLTKWTHALARMSRETGELHYLRWAGELAATAHRAFTYEVSSNGPRRMFWKMSIDLSRSLVPSMGHHDPLDGLMTSLELQNLRSMDQCDCPDLSAAIADFSMMCEQAEWATVDALGIGGLLDAAARLTHMVCLVGLERHQLLHRLLNDAEVSLRMYARSTPLGLPTEQRLAFRELGLAIGFQAVQQIRREVQVDDQVAGKLDHLLEFRPLADSIRDFWSDITHRCNRTWSNHNDINSVMLGTCLLPLHALACE